MSHNQREGGSEGAPFVVKTYQLVSDGSTNPLVSWSDTKDSFIVWKPVDFASEVLPKYFKHNNFCSFIRQLNTYGFHKVEGKLWEFKHELFREGGANQLKDITRRKSKKREKEDEPTIVETTTANGTVQVVVKEEPSQKSTKYDNSSSLAYDTNDKDEVEKLRDLNSLLMKEVIRLQQQQESTQDTINGILSQLMDSQKQQHKLHRKVAHLSKEVSEKYGDNSISLITPPQSPVHPSIEDTKPTNPAVALYAPTQHVVPQSVQSPAFNFAPPTVASTPVASTPIQLAPTTPAPTTIPIAARKPIKLDEQHTLESLLSDESSLLGLDELAHLELTPNIEQELARMLQHTLGTPPQSPQYQPQY